MMIEKKKRRLSMFVAGLVLVLSLTVILSPVSASPSDPVYDDPTEKTLFENELFLGAWCEPESSDEAFRKYTDAGFNVMYLHNKIGYNSNALKYYLNKADDHGLKVMLCLGANQKEPTSIRVQDKNVFDLNDYAAFLGVLAVDEPLGDGNKTPSSEVNAITKVTGTGDNRVYEYMTHDTIFDYMYDEYEYIAREYPNKLYENVISSSSDPDGFGHGVLDVYYDKVLKKMDNGDKLMSMDCYPYKEEGGELVVKSSELIWRLGQLRGISARDGNSCKVNLSYYQQEWEPDLIELISEQELLYQFYTAMCYGINGFVAYKYGAYWSEYSLDRYFMQSYYGDNELIYYNKVATEEIKSFDHIYLQFVNDWQGAMFVSGSDDPRTDMYRGNALASEGDFLTAYAGLNSVVSTQDTLIGIMKDGDGRDGYMLSNQSHSLDRLRSEVTLNFANATRAMVTLKGKTKTVSLNNGSVTLDIEPGGGAFVIPLT